MSSPRSRNLSMLPRLARAARAAALILLLSAAARASSPEEEAGCPVPTLEECQQPGYLLGELDDPEGPPCGALQGANDWTCSQLFQEALESYEVDSSIFAHSLDPAGVSADVVHLPQDSEDATATGFSGELSCPPHVLAYGPSLFPDGQVISPDGEVQSFAAFLPDAGAMPADASGSFAIEDPRGYWDDDGEQMSSCQEYAWERYYDVTKFWFDVGYYRHDSVRTFEIAFAPGGVGTWHLDGSPFRDVTGQHDVLPSVREDVYRNRFFRLPKHPRDPGEKEVPGSPNLRYSLRLYDPDFGEYIVLRIRNAHDKQVTKDMAYYLEHWENMTVEAVAPAGPSLRIAPGGDDGGGGGRVPAAGFRLNDGGGDGGGGGIGGVGDYELAGGDDDDDDGGGGGIDAADAWLGEDDPDDLLEITGQVPLDFSGGVVMRRRFAAELDELYDLQLEKDRLLDEWHALDTYYAGSGWTVEDLLEELDPEFNDMRIEPHSIPTAPEDDGELVGSAQLMAAAPTDDEPGAFAFEVDDDDGGIVGQGSRVLVGQGPPPDPYAYLTPESAARKRVLDGLLAVYEEARSAGCLYDWLTPCDFSPKEFAREAISHAVEEQQAAYEECLSILPPPFLGSLGRVRRIINLPGDLHRLESEVDDEAEQGFDLTEFLAGDADQEALDLYHELGSLAEDCVLEVEDPMTASHMHWIAEQTAACLDTMPEYRQTLAAFAAKVKTQVAKEEAMARVAAIPELLDPETGEFVEPGRSTSWSEEKGTKYFGLEMGYRYEFDTDVDASLCRFELSAGGEFSARAKILTAPIELVDAAAWVKTGEEQVDIHAEVLGIAVFDAIEINGAEDGEQVDFSFSKEYEKSEQVEVGFRTNFFLGPIPLSVKVGAGGRVGFRLKLGSGEFVPYGIDDNGIEVCPSLSLEASLGPYLSVYGFAEFAVDIFIARAGIRGELTIVEVSVPVTLEMALATQASPPDIKLAVGMRVPLKLTTLAGRLEVFGEIGPCPLCKRVSKTLAKWDGFSMERTLFDEKYEVSVGDLIFALGLED